MSYRVQNIYKIKMHDDNYKKFWQGINEFKALQDLDMSERSKRWKFSKSRRHILIGWTLSKY